MNPALAPLRVKKSVRPSGVNVGAPSFAGPEMMPGAKICGAAATIGVVWRAPGSTASVTARSERVRMGCKLDDRPCAPRRLCRECGDSCSRSARIVDIAFRTAAVVRRGIAGGERDAVREALDQIRIPNEQVRKARQIGVATCDDRVRGVERQ